MTSNILRWLEERKFRGWRSGWEGWLKQKSNLVDARCLVGGGGHCVVPGSRAKQESMNSA